MQSSKNTTRRHSFLRNGLVTRGAGAIGAGLLACGLSLPAYAEERRGDLTREDVAILRFLAAVEILESDLWQQYNAYLASQGANPVNLDTFCTLPSSKTTGA